MSFDQFFFLQIIPISLRIILFFLSNYNSSKKKIYYSFSLIIRLLKVFNKRTLKKSFVSRLRLYLSILYSFEIEKARNTPIPPNFKASKKEKNQKSNTLARRKVLKNKKEKNKRLLKQDHRCVSCRGRLHSSFAFFLSFPVFSLSLLPLLCSWTITRRDVVTLLFSLSVRSGARSEVESRSRASTWLKRRASGVTPAASAASAATWQAARQEQAEAGVVYHLGCRSRWDIGRPGRNTRSTFWQPASRTAPSGYVPSVPVSFFSSYFFFFLSFL